MTPSGTIWRRTSILATAGGLVFWLASFAISLTPIAAEYRDALAISYLPMLLAALFAGLIVGLSVSYFLVRFYARIPTSDPISKSVVLSFIALVIVTVVFEVPSRLLTTTSDAWRLFIIGLVFNVVRVFALGVAIGYLHDRLNPQVRARNRLHDWK